MAENKDSDYQGDMVQQTLFSESEIASSKGANTLFDTGSTFEYQKRSKAHDSPLFDVFQLPVWTEAIESTEDFDRAGIKRLREKILMHGAMSLSNVELLTLVISTGAGTENILERMQRIFESHSFQDLLRMDIGELLTRNRIGEAKAVQLVSLLEIARRLTIPSENGKHQIRSPADAANYVMSEMAFLDHEEMRVLLLDTKNYVVANILLYKGTVNSSVVRAAEVFRHAVARNCPSIIIFHNHPSGSPDPSQEDIAVTKQLVEAGKLFEIELIDHIIIGNQKFVSLKEKGIWS